MSIGSVSVMPQGLMFYSNVNTSGIWELDLPDYYPNLPDSLEKIHKKLDNKFMNKKMNKKLMIINLV